jgi:hypothetical protein
MQAQCDSQYQKTQQNNAQPFEYALHELRAFMPMGVVMRDYVTNKNGSRAGEPFCVSKNYGGLKLQKAEV